MGPTAVSLEHVNEHRAAERSSASQTGFCSTELLTDLKPFEFLYMAEVFVQVPSQGLTYTRICHGRLLMQFNT
jgi:hypothetical protein